MTDQPTPTADLIRAAIADAVTICNGPLIDHAASGVLYALGMTEIPPADGAPAPACGEECAESHTYTGRCAQTPVPYCGAYSPPLHIGGEPLIRLRCTLPVGHDHHHSDSHGTRWDNPRTAPDNPAASNNEGTCGYVKPHLPHQYLRLEVLGECPGVEAAGGDGLREQYAAAMREHYLITNRDEADADGNMPCRCGDWREGGDADEYDWDHHLAEAVLAVRDRRMEQLAAGRATWKAKAEEIERDRDRLLAESPWLRASEEDRQTSETALAMQKGISADLRVESRARGEKLAKAEAAIARVRDLTKRLPVGIATAGLLDALDVTGDTSTPADVQRHRAAGRTAHLEAEQRTLHADLNRWHLRPDTERRPTEPAVSPDAGPGHATVTICIHAPDQGNADRWAGTIRDLVQAEHGQDMRLDIRITPEAEAQPFTPPPGSTVEQLPADLLALLDGYISPYRSTACDTAAVCERAHREHPRMIGLLRRAEALHARCRLNHKFTGRLCTCACHETTKEQQ